MIAKLPDDVINQIAAGEVVERPASVIKELVENSIDAQATEISITVKQYGLELIRIIDNGTGVAREDLATVFNKHFTSKLRTTEDLLNVLSFGFRGEALASVGSVAEVDFESRLADAETGYKIRCNYGSLSDITPSPLQEGTRIEVRNLFESIPARKKFLKSKATENKSIIEVLNRFIISNPDISFHVIVDSVRKHYPKAPLNERIENVMHIPYEDLIPIHYQSTEVTLSGFVLHPRHNFSRRTHQYIFVNHRPISDTTIQKAVIDGYDTFLMKQQYPAYVLFIEMPPAKVDINVHPRKTEVRFAASNNIYMQVRTTVNATLLKNSRREMRAKLHYEEPMRNEANVVYETEATYQPASLDNTPHGEFEKFLYPEQTEQKHTTKPASEPGKRASEHALLFNRVVHTTSQNTDGTREQDPGLYLDLKHATQLLNAYIVTSNGQSLVIVDQHAASERFYYEKYLASLKKKSVPSKMLLFPEVVLIARDESSEIMKFKNTFEALGFDIELFGDDTIKCTKAPEFLRMENFPKIFKLLISELLEHGDTSNILHEIQHTVAASLACHTAVRFGDKLSPVEVKEIIKNLIHCKNPYNCPHGRPIIQEFLKYDIEKKFKRCGL